MLNLLMQLGLTAVGTAGGVYILLAGRRVLWVTTALIGLTAVGNLLAVLVASSNSILDLVNDGEWLLLGVATAAATVGIYLGRAKPHLAAGVVGFIVGADIALFAYEISTYLFTAVANLSRQTAVWISLIFILIGGLIGLYLIQRFQEEALILITVVMGVKLIYLALGLSSSNSWTAVILLSLALAGTVVQYADHWTFDKEFEM
ncbi:MAG: sugar MFS transporter [Chloroflexi bacterium]|nr:sugar MFS transporter [Chloroflexota bacterium]